MAGVGQDVGIAGRPGPSVQEVLSQETRSVPAALRQEFNDSRGTEDLDKERYYAREFYRLEEDPDAQVRFAEAAAAIDAARLQLQRNFAELMEDARAGTPVSLERRAQVSVRRQ
jgi:Acyl-CoA dehydrogenase, C-terminal domain